MPLQVGDCATRSGGCYKNCERARCDHLREKELKEGGNGWKTSQRRLRFLEKNSIVMCRGNADMIRRATPYQKAVAIRRAG